MDIPAPIASRLRASLKFAQHWLEGTLPLRCCLCDGRCQMDIGFGVICHSCLQDLPLIGSHCTVCALPLANAITCGDCLKNPKPYQRTLCALRYENPVNYLINRFKNHTQWQIGDFLCDQWLRKNADAAESSVDSVMVAIPSHPKQSAKRGFTPSVYIAENFSKRLGIPIVPLLTARYEATPQKSLNRQQRLGNLKDVFEAQTFSGKKVILVDDVVTSCATTIAASHALTRVGVESIEIWALARTPFD